MAVLGHRSTMVGSLQIHSGIPQCALEYSPVTHCQEGAVRRHQRLLSNISKALVGALTTARKAPLTAILTQATPS